MTVDLERQLDSYGDYVASLVDEVTFDEVMVRVAAAAPEPAAPEPAIAGRRPYGWVRYVAVTAVFVLLSGVVVANWVRNADPRSASGPRVVPTTAVAGDGTALLRARGEELAPAAETGDSSGAPRNVVDDAQVSDRTQQAPPDRSIIFTADLDVGVPDVEAATRNAITRIEALGGELFSQQTRGGAEPVSVLTFRVAPERFQEALQVLGSIGELRSQNVGADDVTERVVDLESRIRTAETSVERLRALLADAVSIEAVAALEDQLLERETDLERLRGRLRTLEAQVAQASLTVTLTELSARPRLQLTTSVYEGHGDRGAACPGATSLSVEPGSSVTLCFEVRNDGDVPLADITVSDSVLELATTDLVVVSGDLDQPIGPGQSVLLAAEITVGRDVQTRTTATAAVAGESGSDGPDAEATDNVLVDVAGPSTLPGFADGVGAGSRVLQSAIGIVVVVAGAVLPFGWILVLLGLVAWWRRRN